MYGNLKSLLEMTEGDGSKFSKDGLGLIVSLVTSNIRSLQFCASKVAALETLTQIAGHVSSETILDRILPFVVSGICTEVIKVVNLVRTVIIREIIS